MFASHVDNPSRGFSLLEVLAVVGLVAILVMITITRIAETSDTTKAKACNHNRVQINSALERYAISNGVFATAVNDVNTPDYFPGGIPVCPVDNSLYTLNTTTHRVDGHAH